MSPLHKESREKKGGGVPVRENTGKKGTLPKHREFCRDTGNQVCLSPKFPDSKDQGYNNNVTWNKQEKHREFSMKLEWGLRINNN